MIEFIDDFLKIFLINIFNLTSILILILISELASGIKLKVLILTISAYSIDSVIIFRL